MVLPELRRAAMVVPRRRRDLGTRLAASDRSDPRRMNVLRAPQPVRSARALALLVTPPCMAQAWSETAAIRDRMLRSTQAVARIESGLRRALWRLVVLAAAIFGPVGPSGLYDIFERPNHLTRDPLTLSSRALSQLLFALA